MFVKEDIYTSSGAVKLFANWTSNVTKHDTSSFYNWETDNEPLYDLEERSYLNWEQHGYPLSCIPGLALTVSADAPADVTGCNSNIFTTVSAALEALPQTLYFPVVIEVANFGDLGYLKLDNIKMGHRGSLEIINRNFVKAYSTSSHALEAHSRTTVDGDLVGSLSSLALSNAFYGTATSSISALEISAGVWSSVGDIRVPNNYNVITECTNQGGGTGFSVHQQMNHRLSVSLRGSLLGTAANKFLVSAYEQDPDSSDVIIGNDVSTVDTTNSDAGVKIRDWAPMNDDAVSLVYGNFLKGIRIRNCDGPLFIRNFFVDGTFTEKVGFNINNSTGLILENCASIRNLKNGFKIDNSDVTITRGIVGYRNYNISSGNRDYVWSSISGYDYGSMIDPYPGNGLEANNSKINFSSTLPFENRHLPADSQARAIDFLCNFSRNTRGMVLNNTVLEGGIYRGTGNMLNASRLVLELNVDKGLEAHNSKIYLDGVLDVHGNSRGITARNSFMELDHLIVDHHQHRGVHLSNSILRYNKNRYQAVPRDAFSFSGNGQHLVVDHNSSLEPVYTSSMDVNGFGMKFYKSFGTHLLASGVEATEHVALLSPVSVRNNSNAVFLHARIQQKDADTPNYGEAAYGGAIEIKDNSKVKFQGTNGRCTAIEGPVTETLQQKKAAVYVTNNSTVEFNGPTVIYQWAVDVLAENNSIMNFNPPRNEVVGGYDVSTFNLKDFKNHTAVELHATRACLVAKNKSTINMRELGDYNTHWSTSGLPGMSNGHKAIVSGCDLQITGTGGVHTDVVTSAGFMQFYPNGNEPALYTGGYANAAVAGKTIPANGDIRFISNTNHPHTGEKKLYYLTDYYSADMKTTAASAVTVGGLCIRAVDDSLVNARNVNFPCGYYMPSDIFYEASAVGPKFPRSLCTQLRIWNIADNSRLNASYLSVSGIHPEDSYYHGPSAVYGLAGSAAYFAPSGTPDTSSLSILDYYGQGVIYTDGQTGGSRKDWPDATGNLGNRKYGGTAPANRGPFRIFTGVDSMAFQMRDAVTTNPSGHLVQIYAQGYNPSGPVSSVVVTTSSLYGKFFKASHGAGYYNDFFPSGFYYGSAMVAPDTFQRILLDESAANTFANAKNGAMGTSGRAQICSIYKAHTNRHGESSSYLFKDQGIGFKSPNEFDLDRDN